MSKEEQTKSSLVRVISCAGAATLLLGLHGCHPVNPEPQFKIENISNDTCRSENPSLACSPSGMVSVAWDDCKAGPSDIWLIEKPLGGQWGTAQNLTQNTSIYNSSCYPTICYDSAGNLHAVWQQAVNGGWVAFYRKRNLAGAWSQPETIHAGLPIEPKLAVDLAGNVHVLLDNINVPGFDICHTMRTTAGTWTPIVHIGDEALTMGGSEVLAITDDGSCHVAWNEFGTNEQPGRILYARRASDGTWTSPAYISNTPSKDCNTPVLATAGQRLYLTYSTFDSLHFRTLRGDGNWSDTFAGIAGRGPLSTSATGDGLGRLLVVWGELPEKIVLARYGGRWDKLVVSDTFADVDRTSLALGPDGRIHLAWDHYHYPESPDVFYTSTEASAFGAP